MYFDSDQDDISVVSQLAFRSPSTKSVKSQTTYSPRPPSFPKNLEISNCKPRVFRPAIKSGEFEVNLTEFTLIATIINLERDTILVNVLGNQEI